MVELTHHLALPLRPELSSWSGSRYQRKSKALGSAMSSEDPERIEDAQAESFRTKNREHEIPSLLHGRDLAPISPPINRHYNFFAEYGWRHD